MPGNWMNYKVGQEVYVASNYSKYSAMIEKVGRKYVYLSGNKNDWVIKKGTNELYGLGFGQVGTVHESESAYAEYIKMHKLRIQIARTDWICNKVSNEQINAIAEILGIES
jgi:hypothetical protein